MAKTAGTLFLRDIDGRGQGWSSGFIGDLPIDEAVAAVQEGRVEFDWPDVRHPESIVRDVLDGLGFASLRDLKAQLDRAQTLEDALREARPYVAGRTLPPGHPEEDWRSQTAAIILARVDRALA